MKGGKPYRLHRQGNLLILRAAAGGTDGSVAILRLLLDTGASYTMLPVEAVEALGLTPITPYVGYTLLPPMG